LVICALGLPLVAAAQDREAPGTEHSQHEQHAAPSAETPVGQPPMGAMPMDQQRGAGDRCGENDAPCRMDEMQAESRMVRQRMGTMEDRLESINN
jgi:hypothetical protein